MTPTLPPAEQVAADNRLLHCLQDWSSATAVSELGRSAKKLNQGNMNDRERLLTIWGNKSRGELLEILHGSPQMPDYQYAVTHLLAEMDRKDSDAGRVSLLERVGAIEEKMPPPPKPEWQTLTFWIAVSAMVVALLSLFRDYFDVEHHLTPSGQDTLSTLQHGPVAEKILPLPHTTTPSEPDLTHKPVGSP